MPIEDDVREMSQCCGKCLRSEPVSADDFDPRKVNTGRHGTIREGWLACPSVAFYLRENWGGGCSQFEPRPPAPRPLECDPALTDALLKMKKGRRGSRT